MAEVAAWTVFAYMNDDDGPLDERRLGVPDWRLGDVIDWCRRRGYDNILLTREAASTRFVRSPVAGVVHHFRGDSDGDRPDADSERSVA